MADRQIDLLQDQNFRPVPNIGNSILHGQNTVAAAGTAELLISATQETMIVTIKALAGNSGTIYVGDSDVSSSNGFALAAGQEVTLVIDNAQANIYIDAGTNSDGVSYIGWTVA